MDFIITWVDSEDENWKKTYNEYSSRIDRGDKREARFRDWKNLQFWFRGVEKFAPWVEKIHLITVGHHPQWLNLDHPKLNLVKHEDFIPEQYLPTFNSEAIELNFHRIKELSEQYVYFNDDFFVIDDLKPSIFFKKGKPCDVAVSSALAGDPFDRTLLQNIGVINKNFGKHKAIKEKPWKWFNIKYGTKNLRTLALLPWPRHTGLMNPHLPQPSLKSTLELIWEKEYDIISNCCSNHFRNVDTISPYLQRYWELASNNFYPINIFAVGKYFDLGNDEVLREAEETILKQKKKLIALDDQEVDDFERVKGVINAALEKILPSKSQFEI